MFKILLLPLSLLLVLTACSEQEQKQIQQQRPALPVEIIKVKSQNIPIWLQYTGKTQASSSQEVRARVTGVLEEVYYTDGDEVKKGQKLFKIEQANYIANVNAAKAKKNKDLSILKLAKADVNRYRPLVDEGLAPRVTLEQYEAQVETIKADVASDEAAVKQAELELSYTIIKAPIDGKTSRRLVDVGNLVGKGESTLLTTVNNTNPLYAYFAPSEEDFQKISHFRNKDKMDAYIEINYQSKFLKPEHISGYVNYSDNAVDPTTSTVSMRAEIPNKDQRIFPGTFVYVNVFVTDQFSLIGVPPQVFSEDQLGKYLYTLDVNNEAKRVYVEPVYESRFFTLIKEDTLKTGDRVVINAILRMKPGLKTSPIDVTDTKGLDAIIKENKLIPTQTEAEE